MLRTDGIVFNYSFACFVRNVYTAASDQRSAMVWLQLRQLFSLLVFVMIFMMQGKSTMSLH